MNTFLSVMSVIGLFVGPIAAVLITLWWQDRSLKRGAKLRLFMTLIAHRKSNPPPIEWVTALNTIDVVYADNPNVLERWAQCFERANQPNMDLQAWNRDYLDLLSEMAAVLRYGQVRQTQMDKFYSPAVHGNILSLQTDLQANLLRVLKATKTFDLLIDGDEDESESKPAPPPKRPRNAFE